MYLASSSTLSQCILNYSEALRTQRDSKVSTVCHLFQTTHQVFAVLFSILLETFYSQADFTSGDHNAGMARHNTGVEWDWWLTSANSNLNLWDER